MSQSSDNEKPAFWVVNISKRNVCLSDLALTIPRGESWNLLDAGHFTYTYEELLASLRTGSLFKKRHIIKIGKGPPVRLEAQQFEVSTRPIQIRKRSIVDVNETEPDYDEMIWSDEQYANEMSDFGEWGE